MDLIDAREHSLHAAALALGRRLQVLGVMAATVESCTGGLIARALTDIAGSSAWYDRGFVTYSNHAKIDLVGVSAATLAAHGAVSEPTAAEMATGGLARSRAGLAMSVTGIAGPGGAVPGKPVGTVCFGWALSPGLRGSGGPRGAGAVVTATRHFEGDRAAVRFQAAIHALEQALLLLTADPKD